MNKEALKTSVGFAILALLLTIAIIIMHFFFSPRLLSPASNDQTITLPVIVIDAGHGGMDGGAVATDGTLEKELNLEIAKILSELLRVSGYDAVMTRNDDTMLTTEDGAGKAKMQDLKQRLTIASGYPDSLMVSIHCNKFPSESCRGLQVYYSDSELAKLAADSIQGSVTGLLQPENHRQTKKADSSIYLLHRSKGAAVLVECGFLSNSEECSLLKQDNYRKKLALSMLSGIAAAYPPANIPEAS